MIVSLFSIFFETMLFFGVFYVAILAAIVYALATKNTKLLDILCGDDDLY